MRTRRFWLAGLLVTLVLAGVVSSIAATTPDGLERVAESLGFSDTAEGHAVDDGPLAGYAADGVDDQRVAGGIAGVVGVLVTLVVAGGLAMLVRRRASPDEPGGS